MSSFQRNQTKFIKHSTDKNTYLARFVFSCSWVSRIVEKATDEDGGEHAIEVDCQALATKKNKETNKDQKKVITG